MFRLVKILNHSNTCTEAVPLKRKITAVIGFSSAVTCSNGELATASAEDFPTYIVIDKCDSATYECICMPVTEDMVFKVEYLDTITPKMGMRVGLASHKYPMDAVEFNSYGKGVIIGIDDDPKFVYIRFTKD